MSGIGIREFREKLLDDLSKNECSEHSIKGFQKACKIFMSRVKNDNEAKAFANLCDLNHYRKEPWNFANQVAQAIEFIENRKRNRALRKGKKLKGIHLLYEDENCFITSPKNYKYSRQAAYLVNGTANWCIATPPDKAKSTLAGYSAHSVFYIYEKGGRSWAALLDERDAYSLKNGMPTTNPFPFTLFEARENNCRRNREKMEKAFAEMLSRTKLSLEKIVKIVRDRIKYRKLNYYRLAFEAVTRCENEIFFKCAEKTNDFEKPFTNALWMATRAVIYCDLNVVKHLYDKSKMVYDAEGKPLNVIEFAMTPDKHDVFEYLLSKGMDVNEVSKNGTTPIYNALLKGMTKEELIYYENHGVDISDSEGRNNLTLGCVCDKSLETLKYLISKGLKLTDSDKERFGDFLFSIFNSDSPSFKIMKFVFEELKLDPDYIYRDGTPLFHLCNHCFSFCLLEKNMIPDVDNLRSRFVNHCTDTYKKIRYLLKMGADVNAKTRWNGKSILDIAVEAQAYPVVRLLLEHGARGCKRIVMHKSHRLKLTEKFLNFLKDNGYSFETTERTPVKEPTDYIYFGDLCVVAAE